MSAIELYEKLSSAPDDKTRARIIAEAFEALEERYPHLADVATTRNLRETELRLLKEIEQIRADLTVEIEKNRTEIEKIRADLTAEVEKNRTEIEKIRADLTAEIEKVRADLTAEIEKNRTEIEKIRADLRETELRLQKEIDKVRLEIKAVEVRLTQAIHRQTLWVVGSVGAIIAFIRLLEWLLTHLPR